MSLTGKRRTLIDPITGEALIPNTTPEAAGAMPKVAGTKGQVLMMGDSKWEAKNPDPAAITRKVKVANGYTIYPGDIIDIITDDEGNDTAIADFEFGNTELLHWKSSGGSSNGGTYAYGAMCQVSDTTAVVVYSGSSSGSYSGNIYMLTFDVRDGMVLNANIIGTPSEISSGISGDANSSGGTCSVVPIDDTHVLLDYTLRDAYAAFMVVDLSTFKYSAAKRITGDYGNTRIVTPMGDGKVLYIYKTNNNTAKARVITATTTSITVSNTYDISASNIFNKDRPRCAIEKVNDSEYRGYIVYAEARNSDATEYDIKVAAITISDSVVSVNNTITVISSPDITNIYPTDIAISDDGYVYIACYENTTGQYTVFTVIDKNLALLLDVKSPVYGPGSDSNNTRLCVLNGNVIVISKLYCALLKYANSVLTFTLSYKFTSSQQLKWSHPSYNNPPYFIYKNKLYICSVYTAWTSGLGGPAVQVTTWELFGEKLAGYCKALCSEAIALTRGSSEDIIDAIFSGISNTIFGKQGDTIGNANSVFGYIPFDNMISVLPKWRSLSGVKIATGSYKGTETYGESNPNSLTFDFVPKFLILSQGSFELLVKPLIDGTKYYQIIPYTNGHNGYMWTEGNSIIWYSTINSSTQFNSGTVSYIAIG